MKITAILVTALLIALSGCAGTPEPSKENTVLSAEAASVSAAAETETEQQKVIKIPVMVSETRYLRNNQVDTKIINTYEHGTDRLLESVTYDKTGETVETAVTTYSDNESETLYHDKEKNLLKKRKNITDSMGNTVESVLFDSRGNQISRSLYSYGDTGTERTKWEIYDSSDLLLGYNLYHYEEGRLAKTESLSPSGTVEEYFLYSYDNSGNLIRAERFNKGGKRLSATVYEYREDLPVNEKIYRGEKTLINEIEYDYSERNGRRVEKSHIKTPDGTVIETVEKEFIFIEKR